MTSEDSILFMTAPPAVILLPRKKLGLAVKMNNLSGMSSESHIVTKNFLQQQSALWNWGIEGVWEMCTSSCEEKKLHSQLEVQLNESTPYALIWTE